MRVAWNRSILLLMTLASATMLLTNACESNAPATVAPANGSAPTPSPGAPASSPVPPSTSPDEGSFVTTGPLVADQQADLGPERDGRIVEISVQIGDHVKAGQLLARLDDRLLRVACDAQNARIAASQAEVRNWKAEHESARADLRRADALLKERIMSQENWEVSKYKVEETAAQVDRYESEQAVAEAELAATIVQLEQSRIVAPFAGVVGRSSARLDEQVKTGAPLFWITAQGPLRVLFTVPETLMSSFTVGKRLDLTTADLSGLRQAGRIFRVSPVVDPASGSVQVIGAIEHPSPELKPGMTMQVRLAQ